MIIQQKQAGEKFVFYVEQDNQILPELVCSLHKGNIMILEHTEVDQSLEGKGVGRQLVQEAVQCARTNNLKIVPQCPFAKALFERKPEWNDVLAPPRQ